jgi:predicted nucleic acid-binding protein
VGTQAAGAMAAPSQPAGLIDTDILIDGARGLPAAITFLSSQQAGTGVQLSVISAMELVGGCRNATALANVRLFLRQTTVMPLTAVSSQTAYQLMESYFLSHGLILPDALIAATALEHGLCLYTKNVRHYQMIPALNVVRPY